MMIPQARLFYQDEVIKNSLAAHHCIPRSFGGGKGKLNCHGSRISHGYSIFQVKEIRLVTADFMNENLI
jgi:hypothetical protein